MVVLLLMYSDAFQPSQQAVLEQGYSKWLDVTVWGGSLLVTGYLMGTLCERKNSQLQELRDTYHGVLMILRHFISKDAYTENHCHRVSVYATRSRRTMELSPVRHRGRQGRRAAARHRQARHQPRPALQGRAGSRATSTRRSRSTSARASTCSSRSGGSLRRVIPIILAHHDKFDGSGYHPTSGEEIPIEARIIAVADVYDSLTSDRPYRKAMSPFDARDIILKGSETEFDPRIVNAFQKAFRQGKLEIWSAPLTAA